MNTDIQKQRKALQNLREYNQKIVSEYDDTYFKGRIETQTVTKARLELKRIDQRLNELNPKGNCRAVSFSLFKRL